MTSDQGHVRSHVEPSRSYCISFDVSMREKHIETIPSDLSSFYQKLEAKKRIWSHMTSNYLKGRSLGQDRIRIIVSGQIWKYIEINSTFSSCYGKNGVWTFSHCLIMVRSQNWPDLRSPRSKFRDIHFVGADTFINSWKFHIDILKL